jgi:hypothetical protein
MNTAKKKKKKNHGDHILYIEYVENLILKIPLGPVVQDFLIIDICHCRNGIKKKKSVQ